jgi:tRNA A-37 threonylcarbamoyl transferase component Bud32
MDAGLLSNRYQVVRSIGTGGMTRVLEAWDRRANCRVAIKVPIERFANDKALLVRLEREVATLAGFLHPNVARTHAVVRHGGTGFVVAELVDAPGLRELLGARGPLPPVAAARAAAGACAALGAAHARGIVHGHLVPANLFLTGDGRVKVADFRLAQAARPFASAPDSVADLRALGRCLAAMLSGWELADSETVRLRTEVPAELAAIVTRAAEGSPDPYRSAADLARDLELFLSAADLDLDPGPSGGSGGEGGTPLRHPRGAPIAAAARKAELVRTSIGSSQLPSAPGAAPRPRRRRGRVVAAGLVVVGLAIGGPVAAIRLHGDRRAGADAPYLAVPAPPSTAALAPTTGRGPAAAAQATTTAAPTTTAPASTAPPATTAPPITTDPGQRTVPDLIGLHTRQASGVLTRAGLTARISFVPVSDGRQVGRVVAQQPGAGTVVPAGSEVTVLVGTR